MITDSRLLGFLLFSALTVTAGPPTDWQQKVEPRVLDTVAVGETEFLVFLSEQADLQGAAALRSKAEKGAYVVERLQEVARRTQAPVLKALEARGLACQPFWIVNMLWVRGALAEVRLLSQRDDVARIIGNPSVRLQSPLPAVTPLSVAKTAGVEWNIAKVHAPDVWALGFTGQGAVIGGQDTGYQWDHPALKSQYRGWDGTNADHNYNWHDAIHANNSHNSGVNSCGYNLTVPCDDDQHGTHTMGIMVGDDGAGNRLGMAPGAKWIGCRNMERGWGTPASYTECFQWFIAPTDLNNNNPDPAKAPDVINNSWTCPPEEGCADPLILETVVNNVRAAGIVVVAAAANDGPACGSVREPPSIYDAVISVAATDNNDTIADFSSRGPVTVDGSNRPKPEISAPGVSVRSSIPANSYGFLSGTSMASPHVAGLVALLISAHPELRGHVDLIERLIEVTAVPLTTTDGCGGISSASVPNDTFGWGRIDALAALGLRDSDGDGLSDYQEVLAGTDPHDAASRLRITSVEPSATHCVISFTSVTNRFYDLERKDDLATPAWDTVAKDIPGTGAELQVPDPTGAAAAQLFYRVRLAF